MDGDHIGRSLRRLEDFRFLTGQGRYVEDFSPPGQLHAVVLRSPHAHALIDGIDTAAAQAMPGVRGVFTAADLDGDGVGTLPCIAQVATVAPIIAPPRPALARDRVRHAGDPVAFIVADTREQARESLVDGWDRQRRADPDQSRIILTHTNAEVRELNGEARDRLRANGELGEDVAFAADRGARDFAAGDRLMFLRNERSLGVKNGTLGTIGRVTPEGMTVRLDGGREVTFAAKDYAAVDHGYAATFHKSQGVTVDRAHVLATPGMDRHSGYVGLSRHRDGVQLHYGRDDFADQGKLARVLSRDRGKDMAGDYAPDRSDQDHARAFADRREIRFPELARQVVEKVRDKVRDGARGMFAGFRPKPATGKTLAAEHGEAAIGSGSRDARPDQARAIRDYARVAADMRRMKDQGLPVLPHQETAARRAIEALDATRPGAARDLASAMQRDPRLIDQAASGNTGGAVRAMAEEQRVRLDPDARADRFVEGWQAMQRQRVGLERSGDNAGVERMQARMEKAAGGLQRDPQLESALRRRAPELEIRIERERSIGDALAQSIAPSRDRDRGMSR